jgi:hypothetical protein
MITMAFVVQIVTESILQNKYVLFYDPELDDDDTYTLVVVDQVKEAKKFDTIQDALAYCSQICPNPPKLWRDTNLDYRPLVVSVNVRFIEVA